MVIDIFNKTCMQKKKKRDKIKIQTIYEEAYINSMNH